MYELRPDYSLVLDGFETLLDFRFILLCLEIVF